MPGWAVRSPESGLGSARRVHYQSLVTFSGGGEKIGKGKGSTSWKEGSRVRAKGKGARTSRRALNAQDHTTHNCTERGETCRQRVGAKQFNRQQLYTLNRQAVANIKQTCTARGRTSSDHAFGFSHDVMAMSAQFQNKLPHSRPDELQ